MKNDFKLTRIGIVILFIIIFSVTENVSACTCGTWFKTKEYIEKADYIALVKIKDIKSMGSRAYYKTIVEEQILYKGSSNTDLITDGANRFLDSTYFTTCDLPFSKDQEWLIFGTKIDGKIHVNYCSGSFQYKNQFGFRNLLYQNNLNKLNEINTYFNKPLIDFKKKNGRLTIFYPNGNTELTFKFKNGKKEGQAKYFYVNGSLMGEENYRNDLLHGERVRYFEEGTKDLVEHFENGIKVDSSNYYEYNYDSGRYYMWFTTFYNKKGLAVSSKTYSIPIKHEGMPPLFNSDKFYLREEWYLDTIKNEITTQYYHSNGRLKLRYVMKANSLEFVGDEVDFDEEGRVTKVLRPKKNGKNEMIYIDMAAWPYYRKN